MGDIIRFPSSIGVTPSFGSRGSVIVNPDVLPIFWGPNWPGGGGMTVNSIVTALNALCAGSYLGGLKQYGFVGPARVRSPRVDRDGAGALGLATPGPGIDQTVAIGAAVNDYVDNLVKHDTIDDVDDNHQLILMIFLDPGIATPRTFDVFGNVTNSVGGGNARFERFEFLDDNTRFELCWISTASGQLGTVMQIASHELVEAISDPFENGWHQTAPSSSATSGQIGDVCNQPGIADGVGVSAYWSVADAACIIPTSGVRRVTLSKTDAKHEGLDGPPREGFVNFGPLCGAGIYGYLERTYHNELVVKAVMTGFESPTLDWVVDGRPVSILEGAIDVAATWDPEPPPARDAPAPVKPSTARLSTFKSSPVASELRISVGPNAGNVSFRIDLSVVESFDTGDVGGRRSSRRTAVLEADLKNQEIVWDSRHEDAKRNCERVKHLFDGPAAAVGPPKPGDPADLVERVQQVIEVSRTERLISVAAVLEGSRPNLAGSLRAMTRQR